MKHSSTPAASRSETVWPCGAGSERMALADVGVSRLAWQTSQVVCVNLGPLMFGDGSVSQRRTFAPGTLTKITLLPSNGILRGTRFQG